MPWAGVHARDFRSFRSLFNRLPTAHDRSPGSVTLDEIADGTGWGIASILSLALGDPRLVVSRTSRLNGLASILVDARDVRLHTRAPEPGMTWSVAADMLGLPLAGSADDAAIPDALFGIGEADDPRYRWITGAEIATFRETFVFEARLYIDYAISRRHVLQRLRRSGATPALNAESFGVVLYRRVDVSAALSG